MTAKNVEIRELDENLLRGNFPMFREPELIAEILKTGEMEFVPEGHMLMDVGRYIKSVPLVTRGSVRVMREDGDGGELFLYYIKPGETCAVSLTCCMAEERSGIRAVTDEDTEMIRIPIEQLDLWTNKFTSFKNFVMNTYRSRYEELLATIDSIAFMKMDERLWKYLSERSALSGEKVLKITHQEIADSLHSTREVISRLLKVLEKEGRINLGRNKIELLED